MTLPIEYKQLRFEDLEIDQEFGPIENLSRVCFSASKICANIKGIESRL